MGQIDRRLDSVFTQVKTNVAVPITVEVREVTAAMIRELGTMGLSGARGHTIFPYIHGKATEAVARAIAANPAVIRVSYDEPVYTRATGPFEVVHFKEKTIVPLSESVSEMGAPALWDQGLTGKGVRIGVIDTGVNQSHRMVSGGLRGVYSAVPNEDVEDIHSHGTWCCGAAAGRPVTLPDGRSLMGVAPGADLFALKALSREGSGQMSWVMDCMEYAVTKFGCQILSMSLGSLFDNGGMDPISRAVNHLVQNYGMICVIAAGNSYVPVSIGSPGGAILALTVGAFALHVPGKFHPSTFSSKGPTTALVVKPDVSAPGGNVVSSDVAELILGPAAHEEYAIMAGTSMATPQVAGCMALLKQARPKLSRADIEQLMFIASMPKIKDTLLGFGPIRVDKMYQALDQPAPAFMDLEVALSSLQVIPYYPLTLIPRPESQETQEIRLPAVIG